MDEMRWGEDPMGCGSIPRSKSQVDSVSNQIL